MRDRALIEAIESGDAGAVRDLLAEDPGLAAVAPDGIPAVRLALYRQRPEVLAALLAADPPLDGLDLAALGRADALRAALRDEPDLAARRSADGFTALHYACFFAADPDTVAALLEAGADPNARAGNPSRVAPLHSAAAARDAAAAALLLDAGADPDAAQAGGYTALHAAAQHDDARLAALLLRHGADRAVRTDAGEDAADIARDSGAGAVLALLAS